MRRAALPLNASWGVMISMNDETKRHWDLKYEQGLPSLTKPDPFFVWAYETFVERASPRPRKAVDLAGGLGRHALWLAQRGWAVTVVDISEVALQKLHDTSVALQLDLKLDCGDVADYDLGHGQFDMVVLFYHLNRRLFAPIIRALRPGGLFFCKMRTRLETEAIIPVATDDPLLGRNELESLLSSLVTLHHELRSVGKRGVVEYVGRKPSV
jgi:SAM-dependent methyltransferase